MPVETSEPPITIPEDLARVSISEVRSAVATSPGVEAGLVTLREDDPPNRSLPIVIGQPEARAIQSAWLGTVQTRPSTWDLFITALAELGARLERAVIHSVEERRHFYACIELVSGDDDDEDRLVLEARPSDAIALALRADDAEMFVAEQVFADMGLPPGSPDN